jgi:replicative DNA helicase
MGLSPTREELNGRSGGARDTSPLAATEAQVPPQNLEAEESALGAMMVSEKAMDAIILEVRLGAEDFYRPTHRFVYESIRQLYEEGQPVDSISVTEHLTQNGTLEQAGGRDAVVQLPNSVPAPGNAKHYGQIVKQNALLRRLLEASRQIESSVHDRGGDPRDLVEQAETLLFKVAHDEHASDFRQLVEVLDDELKRLEKLASGEQQLTGTASGFRDLDTMLGGFQPGNLIIIAARPSMGKSALVCNIAENVAGKDNRGVAFFSLEMSENELAHRFISSRSKVHNDKLRKGQVSASDWPRVLDACNALESAPLWLDDSSDLGLIDLRAKARRLKSSQGLELIIVDYLQLMRAADPRQNRVEQVGQMSRGLKILARELEVPVICLSQLSRMPEQRPDKRPMLSDLRESGNIEQDADVVAFIYRDWVYQQRADEESRFGGEDYAGNDRPDKTEAELIIAKHRNGPTGKVDLVFQEEYPRFLSRSRSGDRPVEQRAGEGPPLVDIADQA